MSLLFDTCPHFSLNRIPFLEIEHLGWYLSTVKWLLTWFFYCFAVKMPLIPIKWSLSFLLSDPQVWIESFPSFWSIKWIKQPAKRVQSPYNYTLPEHLSHFHLCSSKLVSTYISNIPHPSIGCIPSITSKLIITVHYIYT